jgi:hypothetical protein
MDEGSGSSDNGFTAEPRKGLLARPRCGKREENSVRLVLVLFVMAVVLAFAGGTAQANTVRVSKGDAEAIFESFGNGGWAIRRHSQVLEGAPADGLVGSLATIRPNPVFDGAHYCALDWHVIVLAIFDGGDASYTAQDFEAFRATVSNVYTLDGQLLEIDQTATKRFLRSLTAQDITTAYYFQEGTVLAPEALSVGAHTLTGDFSDVYGTGQITISFIVDAPGTGACL